MRKTVYINTQCGKQFVGQSFGASRVVEGEIVFTTAMTGYIETLSDPNFYNKIVVQTFPQIGNYGIILQDLQAQRVYPSAYVVLECCDNPSNFRCDQTLEEYFLQNDIVGVKDIDTRQLAKTIRDYNGQLLAKITFDKNDFNFIKQKNVAQDIADSILAVTAKDGQVFGSGAKYKVALLDLGVKSALITSLTLRDANVTLFPAGEVDLIDFSNFDALVVSDGPSKPNDSPKLIEFLSKAYGNIPILAIGLGHNLLALSQKGSLSFMKNGHRGSNQAVKNILQNRLYTTVQNHDYYVSLLPGNAAMWFDNTTDGSCEGLIYTSAKKTLSVQFTPERLGSLDQTSFVFDEFFNQIRS